MNENDRVRLRHMLYYARKAVTLTQNRQPSDLHDDEDFVLLLAMVVGVIGEAASRVTRETQEFYPLIAWSKIVSMRNRIYHNYYEINYDILWQTTQSVIPQLIVTLDAILSQDR